MTLLLTKAAENRILSLARNIELERKGNKITADQRTNFAMFEYCKKQLVNVKQQHKDQLIPRSMGRDTEALNRLYKMVEYWTSKVADAKERFRSSMEVIKEEEVNELPF